MRLIHIFSAIPLAGMLLSAAKPVPVNGPHTNRTDTLHNNLFTVGIGGALIGGLYDGIYSYKELKQHGNFGLGAPDKLDGELMVFKGKIYQTQSTGKTTEVDDKQLASFGMVNFFQADKQLKPGRSMNKTELFHYLDSVLTNVNGMYAIHISGNFSYIKTRAFPPVQAHQHTPLAEMLNLQHFFEFKQAKGDLIGYRLPYFMDNTNISGYHFHFLSEAKNAGGHIIDLQADDITIEIDVLDSYTVVSPNTTDYQQFNFKTNREEDIKSVERGGKSTAAAAPAQDTMSVYRKKIDEADKEIIRLLGQRMEAARAIGTYKMVHNVPVVQSNRFNEVLQQAINAGAKEGLSEAFIKELYESVHAESVRQQEALKK